MILAVPLIASVAQIVLLFMDYKDHHDEVYYIWMVCDTVINLTGSLIYLIMIENIEIESIESGDCYLECKI
jgi:hypothetical protein